MKFSFPSSQTLRQVVLIVALMLAVYVAGAGGIKDANTGELLRNVACSILAAVICVYLLHGLEKRNDLDLDQIVQVVRDKLSGVNQGHLVRADRNMDMGDEYWVGLIDQLGSSPETVAFVGSRLSWWLKTYAYREPLRKQFAARLKMVSLRYAEEVDGKCMTYVFVTNEEYLPKWQSFLDGVENEVLRGNPRRTEIEAWVRKHVIVGLLPKELVKYSLILCAGRLAITYYASTGRSEDSLTVEVSRTSVMRNLYMEDLNSFIDSWRLTQTQASAGRPS